MRHILYLEILLLNTVSSRGVSLVPISFDAFAQWELLPILRDGLRGYVSSTYDRAGGNEGADASHYTLIDSNGTAMAFDVEVNGAGCGLLAFVRFNHWHGSPWTFAVDGINWTVVTNDTANPNAPNSTSEWLPREGFPAPLALNWAVTAGSYSAGAAVRGRRVGVMLCALVK
jgi:hypothetical protein